MHNKQRITQLEEAHRALHAQFDGLFITCFVMLPLINETQAAKTKLLTAALDALNDRMTDKGYDDAFQKDARATIDVLSDVILLPQEVQ